MCPIPLCNARVGLISIALFPDEAREHEGLLCTSAFQVGNLNQNPLTTKAVKSEMSQNGKEIESEVVGEKSDETESESKAVEGDMVDTQEYLTGIRLAVLVAITTAVAFLVFLDSSILVTVSS
jgi:hypothetical protein